MIIGTMRPEEAMAFDTHQGYHQFTNEDGTKYGSFEVFWLGTKVANRWVGHSPDPDAHMDEHEDVKPGWYWHACSPGCMPDSDGPPNGPFARSRLAREDADPNWEELRDD